MLKDVLVVIGAVLVVSFFGRLIVNGASYLIWRLSGGVGRWLKNNNKKCVWEAMGFKNPHMMDVRTLVKMEIPTPEFDADGVAFIKVEKEMTIHSKEEKSRSVSCVDVNVHKIFPINPRRVRRGCCGIYTLPMVVFFWKFVGGDPICGGGMKQFWPPLHRRLIEICKLKWEIKKRKLSGYVPVLEKEANFFVHKYLSTGNGYDNWGEMNIFTGKEEDILRYAKQNKIAVKPISVNIMT